ncbi:MAG: hypothetical protein H0W72_04615 [Planctomycetes bacterium]|nr:hypothetical protein [Planctomycetota bacterium]
MKAILLILIIFGDPSAEPIAKSVADDLARRGGDQVQVVVGADAVAQLQAKGIRSADLVASPNIGAHLTAKDAIVVIQIDRREVGGDTVVESRYWFQGKSDRHVAVVGKGGDPEAAVAGGASQVLAGVLPGKAAAKPAVAAGDDIQLALLADKDEWLEILGEVATAKAAANGAITPRQSYYQVLAYAKLGQRDAAVESLNRMRTDHGDHFLVAAAAEVIPLADGMLPAPAANDLAPAPAGGDDGSNTLK